MKKLLRTFAIGLVLLLASGGIALAAIAAPDTYTINQINAYRHCIELNDQMYVITFELNYTGANPDEDAGEAWLIRLLDAGDAELGVVAPYPYFDAGYDTGVVAIYFSAADAPVWNGAYKVELTGNPSLDWGGDPPTTTNDAFSSWSTSTNLETTSSELTARIRYLAVAFDSDWGIDLIEVGTGSGSKLTTNGENYFTIVIPYLYDICPNIFSSVVIVPDFEERAYTQTYATTTEARWVGDPLLDLTGLGTTLGVSRMWVTSIGWLAFSAVLIGVTIQKLGSYHIAAFILCILLVIGSVMGLMPFVIAPIVGVLGILAIVGSIAWGGAT